MKLKLKDTLERILTLLPETANITKVFHGNVATYTYTASATGFLYVMTETTLSDSNLVTAYINGAEMAFFGDWWGDSNVNNIVIPLTVFLKRGDVFKVDCINAVVRRVYFVGRGTA